MNFLKTNSIEAVDHSIELNYDHFSLEEVLRKLLPEGIVIPSAYESIGHIAHLNLRDNQIPYKKQIGQVMLDVIGISNNDSNTES